MQFSGCNTKSDKTLLIYSICEQKAKTVPVCEPKHLYFFSSKFVTSKKKKLADVPYWVNEFKF